MAKVWKRKSRDSWVVDVRDRDGKRRRFTAPTREKADQLLAEKTVEFSSPEKLLGDPELTLDEYAKRWLAGLAAEGTLKPRSIASYAHLYKLHVAPTLGARALRDLRRTDIKTLLNAKRMQIGHNRAARLSRNTVRLIRATLSAMLAEALDDNLIEENPATQPKRRKGKSAEVVLHPFDADELGKLLETAREIDPEYYPLFLTLASTGMRPGEAFALEWQDIDFTKRKISIERGLSAGEVGSTKTGEARTVDMSQELAAVLSALYRERQAQTLKHGWGEVPDLVFITAQRGYLDISRVRKRFARVMKKAAIGGHRLYDLRHTFASLHLAANHPLTYVSAQLGHANAVTTLRYYARWLPSAAAGFADDLGIGGSWHQIGTKVENTVKAA